MKRKASGQLQKSSPHTVLAGSKKPAVPKKQSPAKVQPAKTKQPQKPQVKSAAEKVSKKKVEEEEEDEDDYASSGEDIGDIDEYMQGGSEEEEESTVVEFDDGEVSLNLPTKKSSLFDDSDEGEEEKEIETKPNAKVTKKFSDSNQKWLVSKGPAEDNGEGDGESSDEGSEEESEDMLKRIKKIQDKQARAAERERLALAEIGEEANQADESEEEEEENIQDIANRMENLNSKIQEAVGVLSAWRERKPENVSRDEYVNVLKADLMAYFGYTEFLMDLPAEALSHIEANEVPRPLTIRVNTLKAVRKELAQTLINKGVSLEPVKWSKVGLVIYESKVPIGATPEYLSGQYMLQSAASFLPVLALDPQPNEQVLDMCAAPGGKTTYIAAMMKNTGIIHANDKNIERIPALVANIHRMGVKNSVISQLDGCVIPTLATRFDRVLVDAPCMGLGVIAKDRSIKSSKDERDMINCIDIQIKLLLAAIDSVDCSKAAIIVYSTCSISVEENEAIVDKALKKRFVKVVDSGLEFGKEGLTRYRGKTFHPSLNLSRRYYPHAHNIDGFFVCKLHKYANGVKLSNKKTEEEEIELLDHRPSLVLKKNVEKLAEGELQFEADHKRAIDQEKVVERSKKNKDKKARKKQGRLARMKANAAAEEGEGDSTNKAAFGRPPAAEEDSDEDADMEEASAPTPAKKQTKLPGASKASESNGTPSTNGKAKTAANPRRLRGSKQ